MKKQRTEPRPLLIGVWKAESAGDGHHYFGRYSNWKTPMALLKMHPDRPVRIRTFCERGRADRIVQVFIGKPLAERKPEETNMITERTIVVEGHTLTKTAIEKAYAELQKPAFQPGDIVVNKGDPCNAKRMVLGDWINHALDSFYSLTLQPGQVRVTDGCMTYTFGADELVKVEL